MRLKTFSVLLIRFLNDNSILTFLLQTLHVLCYVFNVNCQGLASSIYYTAPLLRSNQDGYFFPAISLFPKISLSKIHCGIPRFVQ